MRLVGADLHVRPLDLITKKGLFLWFGVVSLG